jgi:hypothetical protein
MGTAVKNLIVLGLPTVKAEAGVERENRGTYGLYSKGVPGVNRRGRVRWHDGGWHDGGWYATVERTASWKNGVPDTSVRQEILVNMRASWGRKSSMARLAVRGMWSTREEAEAAALLVVVRHPKWIGLLEVRKIVL